MPISHVVEQGECLSSIALDYGFKPDTLWNHGDNADLKAARVDGNVLLPGDVVVIPDLRLRTMQGATDQSHKFKLLGVPAYLRLQLLEEDEPRANAHYVLTIDGVKMSEGQTDGEGRIEEKIPPDAQAGTLTMDDGDIIELQLGALDPHDTVTGLQGRLLNLGFDCGAVDGDYGDQTREAVSAFQRKYGLEETGDLDSTTKSKLLDLHGDNA
jgi:Putative peptidoglycan binding domain